MDQTTATPNPANSNRLVNACLRADHNVETHLTNWRRRRGSRTLSWIGSRGGDLVPTVTLAWWVWRERRNGWTAVAVIVAQALTLNYGVKNIFARTRPNGEGSTHSFPSGHTATAAALAALAPGARAGLAGSAAATGCARLLRGVHWTSDVIAGAAVGTAIGAIGRAALRRS